MSYLVEVPTNGAQGSVCCRLYFYVPEVRENNLFNKQMLNLVLFFVFFAFSYYLCTFAGL